MTSVLAVRDRMAVTRPPPYAVRRTNNAGQSWAAVALPGDSGSIGEDGAGSP